MSKAAASEARSLLTLFPRGIELTDRLWPALRDRAMQEGHQPPAGDQAGIEPAGEMWSVVTESPSQARTRAPEMSVTGAGSMLIPAKNGGLATYVDAGSQA